MCCKICSIWIMMIKWVNHKQTWKPNLGFMLCSSFKIALVLLQVRVSDTQAVSAHPHRSRHSVRGAPASSTKPCERLRHSWALFGTDRIRLGGVQLLEQCALVFSNRRYALLLYRFTLVQHVHSRLPVAVIPSYRMLVYTIWEASHITSFRTSNLLAHQIMWSLLKTVWILAFWSM